MPLDRQTFLTAWTRLESRWPDCRRRLVAFLGLGRNSLVNRLLGLLLLGAMVIYLIVNVGLWWTSARLLEDSLEKQAVKWLAELDDLGTPLYVSRGGKRLANVDQRIRNFPEIAFVRYYDARGEKVLGQYGRRIADEVPAPTAVQFATIRLNSGSDVPYVVDRSPLGGAYLRVLAPVRVKSIRSDGLLNFSLESTRPENVKTIGYIDLGIDAAYYRGELIRGIAFGSLVIAVMFSIVLVIGHRLIKRALAPLTDLQVPLARLANGDIDVTVESSGHAEIAAIGDALNTTIRALKLRDEALRRLAERDPLTGLVNRGYFDRILELELQRLKQTGAESALYFIDLDQFKYVNDTLGHAAGDRLLIQVADLLRARLRENDVISRFGGDEFTVLARDVSRSGAVEIARAINQLIRDACLIEGTQAFNVNCSIGVTMIGPGGCTVEESLAQADMACYAAKSNGRNRYQMHEPSEDDRFRMTSDIGWSQTIKQALKEDRFRLVYQPILGVSAMDREYYEVLLRLPGAGGEIVMPAVFLPVAQRFGLLADIDRWVIAHALKALAAFRKAGRGITFSINLSGQSFEDPTLPALIRECLVRYKLPGQAIVFEITEQTAVRYLDRARRLIQEISDLGCRFALDDFGSGFSSFSHLKHLTVDFIKIDGGFIKNMTRDTIDQAMVRSIIQIACALGKKTIAEFVQDAKTAELLREAGVDYLQGYYIGMPSEDLLFELPLRAVS